MMIVWLSVLVVMFSCFCFFVFFKDTINTQVHETMKTTPYELVFGQPPRTVIAPDTTVGGIVDEVTLQHEDSSGDEVEPGSKRARQEDGCSNGRIHEFDHDDDVSGIARFFFMVYIIMHHFFFLQVGRYTDHSSEHLRSEDSKSQGDRQVQRHCVLILTLLPMFCCTADEYL